MDKKLVSVIIPTLKEQDYIELLLISIRHQTYKPIEIVISDSSAIGDQIATELIAMKYGARMVTARQLNVAAGRNKGAEAARGEILIFCDADCVMAPDFVERMMVLLENGARLAHGVDYFHNDNIRNTIHSAWMMVKPRLHTTGRGIAISKSDFWEIGGYDVKQDPMKGYREDLDLGQRVELHFGKGSVQMDRFAIVAEAARRPWWRCIGGAVWKERGWRKGTSING